MRPTPPSTRVASRPARPRLKRLLLVSYHFGAGGSTGGLRWHAMARGLAGRGWRIDVLARAGHGTSPDAAVDGIRIHAVPEPTWPYAPMRALVRLRHLLRRPGGPATAPGAAAPVLPDDLRVWRPGARFGAKWELLTDIAAAENWLARLVWVGRVVRRARRLARSTRYSAVVVSSPPHATQLAGARIARATGIPFLPDFRDPWILGDPSIRVEGRLDRLLGRLCEPMVLRSAHTAILNTPRMERAARSLGTSPGLRTVAIPNGYDPLPAVQPPDRTAFRVLFSGNLYPFMDPRPLFAACSRLKRRWGPGPGELRVEFVGAAETFNGVSLHGLAAAYGLEDAFVLHPRVPRETALRHQQAAAVLVVLDSPYPYVVPMKFYDQVQLKGVMLLLGEGGGALADAADEAGLAVCRYDDDAAIDAVLDDALERWRRGRLDVAADRSGAFARRRRVDQLEALLLTLQRES